MNFVKIKCIRHNLPPIVRQPIIPEEVEVLFNIDCIKAMVGKEVFFKEDLFDPNKRLFLNGIEYTHFEFIDYV